MKTQTVPIGSITAFVPKISRTDRSSLPVGVPSCWAICDGSRISEGIWTGMRTPRLNEGRFLRGGSAAEVLTMQEESFKRHRHALRDPGHSHKDQGHIHGDDGITIMNNFLGFAASKSTSKNAFKL